MSRYCITTALLLSCAGELLGGCAHTGTPHAAAAKPAPPAAQPDAAAIRKAKVAELIADARNLYDAQQYREAQDLLRQAMIIDPQDESAALFYRLVSTKLVDMDYQAIQHRTGVEISPQHVDSGDTLIPYADLLVGGDGTTWPELVRHPAAVPATQPASRPKGAH